MSQQRCSWANSSTLYLEYHDSEWGVPVHNERLLFEILILEGAKAGLSWSTILNKRQAYIQALDNFEQTKVTSYDDANVHSYIANTVIVRTRLKLKAAINNK